MSARDLTYVLPLRRRRVLPDDDLFVYLDGMRGALAAIVVADGSPAEVAAEHRARLSPGVQHLSVPARSGWNGKVLGVVAALAIVETRFVIIADDDVRHTPATLAAIRAALETSDVVRPQNYFAPRRWHTYIDESRSLVARALGGDWPGTLGVRIAKLPGRTYAGCVLFENLELVRTIRAAGGREHIARDVFVARRPPSFEHYLKQRVRQAYDEFARPPLLLAELAMLPVFALAVRHVGLRRASRAACCAAIALAEYGRLRDGGRSVFSAWSALCAPLWLAERALTSWLALAMYLRGGAAYSDGRFRTAAHSIAWLQRHSPLIDREFAG